MARRGDSSTDEAVAALCKYDPELFGRNHRRWDGQRVLVAIGCRRDGSVLGYDGGGVANFISDCDDRWQDAEDVFPSLGYPSTAGIYLWEGEITLDYWEEEYGFGCKGEFRPATAAEIAELMGVEIPKPATPEDVRED